MATIKISKPIKVNLKAAIDYVMDKNKTLDHTLVSTFGCNAETTVDDFNEVLDDRRSTNRTVLAQHFIQSFKPGEVDLNTAHEIGRKLADDFTEGRYQYVLTTHADQKHIHNHIVFNNVSYIDFKPFKSKKKNIYKLRDLSDGFCREHGLSVVEKTDDRKKRIDPKYYRGNYRNTFRNQLKDDMDRAIREALNFQDFFRRMELLNWDIRQSKDRKFTTFRHKTNGQKRPIRMERLGAGYSKHMIEFRIDNEFVDIRKHEFKPLKKEWVENVINLTSDKKFVTHPGLNYWAVRHNNKAILATLNRMNQLGCGTYFQMQNHIKNLQYMYENDSEKIADINNEINYSKDILFKAQEMKKVYRLLEHAALLEGNDKEVFTKKHKLDSEAMSQFNRYKSELIVVGVLIESEDNLDSLIEHTSSTLEEKRNKTKSILTDQQKGQSFLREMQYLSNNYDIFVGRAPKYDIEKERTKYR